MGFLAATWIIVERHQRESQNRRTEVVLDYPALMELAEARRLPLSQLLEDLKADGFSSVALPEMRLEWLQKAGAAVLVSGQQLQLFPSPRLKFEARADRHYLILEPPLATAVAAQLERLDLAVERVNDRVLELAMDERALRALGLGFEPGLVERLHQEGWRVWIRPENYPGLTDEQVAALYSGYPPADLVAGVVFAGNLNEAVGYPDALEASAEQLRQRGWNVGYIELSPGAQQKGIETLVRKLPHQTTRLMAVSPAHQAKLAPYRVAAMYSLGARERNIRVLYLRPYDEPGGETKNEELLAEFKSTRYPRGPASVFPQDAGGRSWLDALVLCGSAAATLLLLGTLFEVPLILAGALLVGFPLLFMLAGGLQRILLIVSALGTGIVISSLGFALYFHARREPGNLWAAGLKLLWQLSLLSLMGAVMTASLLDDTTYLLGVDRFRGVKLLTLAAPVLVVVLYFMKRQGLDSLRASLQEPVRVLHLILGGALGLGVVLYTLRSGNQSGAAASDYERWLRVLLDQTLGVRPRFKEFMLAHPALFCLPAAMAFGSEILVALVLLVAATGQVGMIDTFAHIHTPVVVSLIRSFLGILLGSVAGAVGVGLITLIRSRLNSGKSR